MSDTLFVDTQFVVALTNRRDLHHLNALRLRSLFQENPLVTTEVVLFEIGNGLAATQRTNAIGVIEDFQADNRMEIVRPTPELFDSALLLYKSRPDKEWGLVDCLSFVVMRERGISDALTYDNRFVQAGFRALLRGVATLANWPAFAAGDRTALANSDLLQAGVNSAPEPRMSETNKRIVKTDVCNSI